jgi:hypothetical protein
VPAGWWRLVEHDADDVADGLALGAGETGSFGPEIERLIECRSVSGRAELVDGNVECKGECQEDFGRWGAVLAPEVLPDGRVVDLVPMLLGLLRDASQRPAVSIQPYVWTAFARITTA